MELVIPLRVSKRDEGLGLDVSQHGEEAYLHGEGALLILKDVLTEAPSAALAGTVLSVETTRS